MNTLYKFLLACAFASTVTSIEAANATLTKEAPTSTQTATTEKFTNSEKGYSLDYPSDWKKSDVPQLDLVLFAPPRGQDAIPHASLNIVSEKVGSEIHLEQFYSESAANLSTALKEVHVEKSGSSQLNGTPSKWVIYTHVMQGMQFRVLQYFIVANESIYLVTFSTIADDFETYRPEFEKIINSFKITHAEATKTSAPKINVNIEQNQPQSAVPAK